MQLQRTMVRAHSLRDENAIKGRVCRSIPSLRGSYSAFLTALAEPWMNSDERRQKRKAGPTVLLRAPCISFSAFLGLGHAVRTAIHHQGHHNRLVDPFEL